MPTPETWQGEAERLARYAAPRAPDAGDERWLEWRLRTDSRFRAGWNSALWEVHKFLRDGAIDYEVLKGMAAR